MDPGAVVVAGVGVFVPDCKPQFAGLGYHLADRMIVVQSNQARHRVQLIGIFEPFVTNGMRFEPEFIP
jgi:hypothetical protein